LLKSIANYVYKKLSCRGQTVRYHAVETFSTAAQLNEKSHLKRLSMLPSEKIEKRRIGFESKFSNCTSLLYYFNIMSC